MGDASGGFSGGNRFSGTYGNYSGSRSYSSGAVGAQGYGARSSYDNSWSDARGGSVSVDGSRGAVVTPWGAAAGGTRDVTATTAGGRSYSSDTTRGAAVGAGGNYVAGGSRYRSASGPYGGVSSGTRWGAAGGHFPTDMGLSHYSAAWGAGGAVAHGTAYWSHGYVADRAGYVRTGFAHYDCFTPTWYANHPVAWAPAAFVGGTAWGLATWPAIASFASIAAAPVDYDYGSNVVYQDNNVYVNGTDMGTQTQYAQQANNIAAQGQAANPAPTDQWTSLGVFALVQGDDKASNDLFQLAVDSNGIIRGNYYDALMNSTSPVYGSVDKNSQRAAWTIGNNKTTVFETGIYNLTKDQTPVLVHFGGNQTQQWLLVRMQQQQQQQQPAAGQAGGSAGNP
ncbi:MAG: hypothetical protein U1D30_08050 [Planctomycetota bacterium]